MNGLLHHGVLLCQALLDQVLWGQVLLGRGGRIEGLSRGFRGRRFDSGDVVTALLIFVGIGLGIWLLSYVLSLRERRRGYASPLGLFLSLCKAHRLRWPEWWLLWRVARAQRLRDPAQLFLQPQRLQPANLGPSLKGRLGQLESLRARLFAEPEEDAGTAAGSEPPEISRTATPLPPVASSPALDVPPWPPAPTAARNEEGRGRREEGKE